MPGGPNHRPSGAPAAGIAGARRPLRSRIGPPVFSYGGHAPGPVRLDPREPDALRSARFGEHEATGPGPAAPQPSKPTVPSGRTASTRAPCSTVRLTVQNFSCVRRTPRANTSAALGLLSGRSNS